MYDSDKLIKYPYGSTIGPYRTWDSLRWHAGTKRLGISDLMNLNV